MEAILIQSNEKSLSFWSSVPVKLTMQRSVTTPNHSPQLRAANPLTRYIAMFLNLSRAYSPCCNILEILVPIHGACGALEIIDAKHIFRGWYVVDT